MEYLTAKIPRQQMNGPSPLQQRSSQQREDVPYCAAWEQFLLSPMSQCLMWFTSLPFHRSLQGILTLAPSIKTIAPLIFLLLRLKNIMLDVDGEVFVVGQKTCVVCKL
jgi:hypothetical protein